MLEILGGEGIVFKEIFIDHTLPSANAPTRKPGTAMLTSFLAKGVDMEASFVIGDRLTDIQLAKNLGCRAIYISDIPSDEAALSTSSWNEIYSFLTKPQRKTEVKRKTNETEIFVSVNLDGTGKSAIETGTGFFNHMLEQISRHGDIDLTIQARGDLHVDLHHTTEDVGIAMGEALLKALGGKKGIERYSFVLPMDDSLAQVALDFGGRPWLVWDVNFGNKMIGEMPSEMLFHFFKSLSDNAKCNLNIKVEGDNDHHKAEAIFKAFARALKAAVRQTGDYRLPTTKGKL
jgi:imidazoleglycerol-phosphate dehydratase/histidinol-phosphatase